MDSDLHDSNEVLNTAEMHPLSQPQQQTASNTSIVAPKGLATDKGIHRRIKKQVLKIQTDFTVVLPPCSFYFYFKKLQKQSKHIGGQNNLFSS